APAELPSPFGSLLVSFFGLLLLWSANAFGLFLAFCWAFRPGPAGAPLTVGSLLGLPFLSRALPAPFCWPLPCPVTAAPVFPVCWLPPGVPWVPGSFLDLSLGKFWPLSTGGLPLTGGSVLPFAPGRA